MEKFQSLADYLGVTDPRPEDLRAKSEARPSEPTPAQILDERDPTAFCKKILDSREFRQYIMNGIVLGDIPPAVMCRVIDHAWGKPVERVEVRDTTNELEAVTPEQLESRALRLAEMARSIRLAPMPKEKESVH